MLRKMSSLGSVAIPVKNGGSYFRLCLESLLQQTFSGSWEISIYDDGSTDKTTDIVKEFIPAFKEKNIDVIFVNGSDSGGVGFAKNRAVRSSNGKFICFQDADDISLPNRLHEQFTAATKIIEETRNDLIFLGSRFTRDPPDATVRYSRWANSLHREQIKTQIYTANGPTLIAPTWFMSRKLFDNLGGFVEVLKGYPEDLEFFYRAIDTGCELHKVNKDLVVYRYHPGCESFGVSEETIWNMRLNRLKKSVLPSWNTFSIWNAGKQGKKFLRSLSAHEQAKVTAFCDVDIRKLSRGVHEVYDEVQRKVVRKIPILSVKDASPPIIVCVKLDMTGGDLEKFLSDSGWSEGLDYALFS